MSGGGGGGGRTLGLAGAPGAATSSQRISGFLGILPSQMRANRFRQMIAGEQVCRRNSSAQRNVLCRDRIGEPIQLFRCDKINRYVALLHGSINNQNRYNQR
jgi:hypothetical protein